MEKFRKLVAWFGAVGLLVALGYSFYLLFDNGLQVWFVVFLAIYILNFIFAGAIFSQRRHPWAKLSWMMVIIALPFFGHAIFILFGRRFKGRRHQDQYLTIKQFEHEDISVNKNVKGPAKDIFIKQSNMSNRGVYDGNVQFFDNGTQAFKEMFADMRKAKKFIHVHFYIIHPGEIYEEFKSILLQKAKDGVEIRFIVDDFGRWAMPWYEIKELQEHGIEIEIFGKVTFPFIGSQNGYRTHRKMVIVDGETVHTGGMNIGDEYANLSKKYGNWVDFQTKITGKSVRAFSILFLQDWSFLKKEQLNDEDYLNEKSGGESQMILVEDGPSIVESIIEQSIISWILHAKKSIKIATPYFVPTNGIMNALKSSAMQGIDVTIFLPGKADKKSVLIASKYWAKELMPHGVKFKQVNNMLIHSKIGTFDGEYAYAGTANIDMRSIYSQFEFISLIHGPAVKGVQGLFRKYEDMAHDLTIEDVKMSRVRDRFIRVMISVFAPLM